LNVIHATEPFCTRAGQATLAVEIVHGQSAVTSASATSPMKVLTPVVRGRSVWAFTSSFGGGLVAGDQTGLAITVGPGARCLMGTQSSTKVYRNPTARPCSHTTSAAAAAGALLVFAPEPVQAFADSHYTQRQEFRLETGAGLVLLDWFTAGRAARGERWAFAHFASRNDVFMAGQRVVADAVQLRSPEASQRMGRFDCLATLLLIGAPLQAAAGALLPTLSALPVERRAARVCVISPVREGVLVRIAGQSVEDVRRELHQRLEFTRELLGDHPWARRW